AAVTPEVASSSLVGPASSREKGFSDFAESLFLWFLFLFPTVFPTVNEFFLVIFPESLFLSSN
ncbi:MAG: hypothetical protein OER59_00090, partial [Desulfobulbaceae bacterium]|nr:hypothetical protein [Desulfobulbaceae bacterium]